MRRLRETGNSPSPRTRVYARIVRWVGKYVQRRRVPGLAAEVAFWLFLSAIPLAVVAGMVAAKLAIRHSESMVGALGGMPPLMRALLERELARLGAWNGGSVGPIGAIVFVWLASSGIHALFDAFEAMTGCSRSWVRLRLASLASCIFLAVGGAAIAVLGTGIAWVQDTHH